MKISADYSVLARTRWYEFASRFLLGGTVTALAGIIARHYGPRRRWTFSRFSRDPPRQCNPD